MAFDEEVDGVVYNIYWNGEMMPWHTKTRMEASGLALGCQWGAHEMLKRMSNAT